MTVKTIVFDAYGTLYDIQSVAGVTEAAFPGHGELITQIWRLKQLEYTWLRSLMGRFVDFWEISRESLAYTLDGLGLRYSAAVFERIMDKYLHLDLYPDAAPALAALRGRRLAILSNGSQNMLDTLVRNSGLDSVLDATLSIDTQKIFKPSPRAYELIERRVGTDLGDVLFVSSNAFDACGAKSHGLKVAWIERVSAEALRHEIQAASPVGPVTIFKLMRARMENFGLEPDYRIRSLSDLPGLLRAA